MRVKENRAALSEYRKDDRNFAKVCVNTIFGTSEQKTIRDKNILLTRLKLWQLQKIAGWDKMIYWDTDNVSFCYTIDNGDD